MGRKPLSPIEKSKRDEERAYERLAAMLRREGLYVSPLQQDEGVADFVVDATLVNIARRVCRHPGVRSSKRSTLRGQTRRERAQKVTAENGASKAPRSSTPTGTA